MTVLFEMESDVLVDQAFGHWLAGFTDGEGCFRIHKEKGGLYYACHYQIKLRADDTGILRECQRRTGFGNLRIVDSPTHPQVIWVAQSRSDCWKAKALFDKYPLRAKKARDFAIWCRALHEWTYGQRGNRWHGPRDWTEMERLKAEMELTRSYEFGEGGEWR